MPAFFATAAIFPAAVIATLRPELVQAKRRLSRLQSLPPEPRFPFRAEEAGLGESIVAAEKELKSLRSQATANRLPSGAGLHLLQGLLATFAECGPQCPHSHWRAASPKQNGPRRRDTPRAKARCCKRCLNRWTDMALDELGVDHSDPKKNPRRFRGG